jgi:hypothetical protein
VVAEPTIVWVTVSALPSGDTTLLPTATSLPFLKRATISVLASTGV